MDDTDFIPLSALQHYLYCPRQCALIHLERLWEENAYTAQGRLLHDRADRPGAELRHGVRTLTALPLAQAELGIGGVADIVEMHPRPDGPCPYPVEYKRGRPKSHRADEVQLCAQALCLEAMFGRAVPEGALYYGRARRRKLVCFDPALRELTLETIQAVRAMFTAGCTPTARYLASRCDACSLIEHCQPRLLGRTDGVDAWLHGQLDRED
ncbi:CRISPR-associated protein Cas4 [Marichromatium bheemlicum]|uniref:CRISPR-associated exonuclease Cas4 n=1 Tax=Marichromatium bheemlicum TaxID=365339 RepID=A0ABX1I478_9GAMM|nr:CRISPR-associated protein Cas4 [Marichromatium bheemlicum]NKN31876.1 CRISPR-associated protein Cas4 [Marichromatium bheemlicum]